MLNRSLRLNHRPSDKQSQGAIRRMRASNIILGMILLLLLVWLAAYACLHIHNWSLT